MRKLKLQVQMTVDGYIAGPNGEMDFMIWNWDDEFHLFINPAAIGKGMPIFEELASCQNLALVKSKSFGCGIVVLNYILKPN